MFDVLGDSVEVLKWPVAPGGARYVAVTDEEVSAHRVAFELISSPENDDAAKSLAMLATHPLRTETPVTAGASVTFPERLWHLAPFRSYLIVEAAGHYMLGPSEHLVILRAVPVTSHELALFRSRGMGQLLAAWDSLGIQATDPHRRILT